MYLLCISINVSKRMHVCMNILYILYIYIQVYIYISILVVDNYNCISMCNHDSTWRYPITARASGVPCVDGWPFLGPEDEDAAPAVAQNASYQYLTPPVSIHNWDYNGYLYNVLRINQWILSLIDNMYNPLWSHL